MNEMCKYCETSGTCLEIAEYNSFYCRLHRKIPIVIEKTYEELEKENQHLKEEFDRMFAIYHSRKLIKKFNDEYDEENYWYLRTYGNFDNKKVDWYDFGCLVNLGYKWIKELGWDNE